LRFSRKQVGRYVYLHGGAQEALQERIVKLLGNVRPLRESFLKPYVQPSRHSVQAQTIKKQLANLGQNIGCRGGGISG
jgi:hypothetical protein